MRTYSSLIALAALVVGCSGVRDTETATTDSPGSDGIAKTQQKAQFADNTVINIVDPDFGPSLTVTADIQPVTVEIFYVSDKTTDSGHQVGNVTLVQTIDLAADQTVRHMINMSNPAFAGGYGTILLDSIGNSPLDVFQTYVQYGGSMFSVGGSVFTGGSYRIPYWSGTLRMVLAITNQSDFDFDIQLLNLNTTQFKTITLPVLSTYKFDSFAEGWNLSGTNAVQLFTTAGGTVALSGYMDRLFQRIRITPVKAAPYF